MLLLVFLIKLGNELGAEAHRPEPPFDFGNLLIINRGAKLIVGNESVIGGTEGLEHGLVFIGERGDKHDERHKTADEEADFEVERAEYDNDSRGSDSKESADAGGDVGVSPCADGDKLLIKRVHLF